MHGALNVCVGLSPAGKWLSLSGPPSNKLVLHAARRDGGGSQTHRLEPGEAIQEHWWLDDQRIALRFTTDGRENQRLAFCDVETGRITRVPSPIDASIIPLWPGEGAPWVKANLRDRKVYDLYRVNPDTGALSLVARNPGNVDTWFPDRRGQVRLALVEDRNKTSGYLAATDEEGRVVRPLVAFQEGEIVRPLMFNFDNTEVLLGTTHEERDAPALAKMDVVSGMLSVITEDCTAGFSVLAPGGKIAGFAKIEEGRRRWRYSDERYANVSDILQRVLGDVDIEYHSASADGNTVVICCSSDTEPATWCLIRFQGDTFDPTPFSIGDGTQRPEPGLLAPMKPIRLTARDGLELHGFLTQPKFFPRGDPPPLVLLVHGGPADRDVWGFDPTVQFLANRGFAVLQVNFRGSDFGRRSFLDAGNRQWGRKMQDDLTDAVRWAIAQGYADPDRVVAMGMSYGGYAALAGACLTPELYCAAISINGPSDLVKNAEEWIKRVPTTKPEIVRRLGDPRKDRKALQAVSPVHLIPNIRCPLLIVQSEQDIRISKRQTDVFVRKLRRAKKDVDYVVLSQDGHVDVDLVALCAAVERFLDRTVPLRGGSSAAPLPKQPESELAEAIP